MKEFKNMFFGISEERMGDYGDKYREFKALNYKKYTHELKKIVLRTPQFLIEKPYKKYAYITGRVKKSLLRGLDKYLMLLDSDGIEDRERAVHWLNKRGIRHVSINSSPGRFWIVCDKIDTVSGHTYLMDEIPGIDKLFTDCCRKQGVLLYRGFPKPGFTPKFMDDISDFKGQGVYEKWVLRFKEYWESEDMQEIAANLFMEAL